jgi:hypothetical protein
VNIWTHKHKHQNKIKGPHGINVMNAILLSLARRTSNLDTCYLDCPALHLNYCIKHLLLLLRQHSFTKFSCNFGSVDERSICKLFKMMQLKLPIGAQSALVIQ